ncbi:MAG: hypothetical protein IJJ33_18920 [Victivallales bacterium]|nr:hypothetical protein [Victivallales bacterium]
MVPFGKVNRELRAGILTPPGLAIVLALFLRPGLALVTVQVQRRWWPSLATILLALLVACSLASCSAWRRFAPEAERVAEELGDALGPITLKDGVLSWRTDAELPFTSRFGENAAVQVIGSHRFVEGTAQKAISDLSVSLGVLIYPTGASYWFRDEDDTPLVKTMISEEQLRKLDKNLEWGNKEMKAMARLGTLWACPVLGFVYFLSFAKTIGFCMLAFLFGSLLFNREAGRSFLDTLLVSLSSSVAPTLVSLVWYAAAPDTWSFDTIYCLAFLLYLIYVTIDTRGLIHRSHT